MKINQLEVQIEQMLSIIELLSDKITTVTVPIQPVVIKKDKSC
jgi:hypothetical protein